jgi:hypothetical protein
MKVDTDIITGITVSLIVRVVIQESDSTSCDTSDNVAVKTFKMLLL